MGARRLTHSAGTRRSPHREAPSEKHVFFAKEDLALDLGREYTEGLARTVRGRPPGRSALDALREAFLASVARHDPVIGFCGPPFARMIAGSPALLARLREFHGDRERTLAAALAEEAGTTGTSSPDDFRPRAAAALIAAAHRALFDETFRRTLAGQSDATIAAAVTDAAHHAFALLTPALGPRP
ncbi:hypothetical protein GCM10009716_03710 [Streptomyces sodiiphilus]|uniref:TetR family transcriptional regulator n=1 Tax=Streptomyces sodiiphilus TaxID=226217 RepID=A0ABN2NRZ6_9ACTN